MATNHHSTNNDEDFEFISRADDKYSILLNEQLFDAEAAVFPTFATNSNDLIVRNEYSVKRTFDNVNFLMERRIFELEKEVEKWKTENCLLHEHIGMINGEKAALIRANISLADELKEANRELFLRKLIDREKEEKVKNSNYLSDVDYNKKFEIYISFWLQIHRFNSFIFFKFCIYIMRIMY